MKKKIFLPLLLVFISVLGYGQITLTTTSNSANWSPYLVTNSGETLTWTAASNGDFGGQIQNANDPTFDFSDNVNNQPIVIKITNTNNDFSGLTALDFWGDDGRLHITDIDLTQATALTTLNMRYNDLTDLDISQNTELTTLIVRGDRQLEGQALNTSTNTKLTSIRIDGSRINSVDFSNNTLLTSVFINNARLTTAILDQVLIDLDTHGLTNGILKVDGNTKPISSVSLDAYNSLIDKDWSIDVPAPVPNIEMITFKTLSNNDAWQLGRVDNNGLTLHWKAEYENTGTVINEYDDDRPVFDFHLNTNNDPILITITSEDGFDKLIELSLYIGTPVVHNPSGIYQVDLANADALQYLYPAESNLESIDVSQNTQLYSLFIHGLNKQLLNQQNNYLDLSTNSDLARLFVQNTYISDISSLSDNPALYIIDLRNSEFTSAALDQVLIELDNNGINNPAAPPAWMNNDNINLANNPGSLTSASYTAYNNLISKGWTIDVPAPPAAPGSDINITGNGNSIPGNGTNAPSPTDDTDFGSTTSGTTITKTFTIENLGDQPLNLTGNPDLVAISGTNAADFTVSALPTTSVAIGAITTFDVTFNANSLGNRTAVIIVESDDSDEASYTFNIQAESTQAPGPEINVTGIGISIPSGNSPIIADDTDFGQVVIGTPVTHTFTIENLGDSDLTINYFFTNTSNYFSFNPSGGGGITLTPGSTTTIDAIFDPSNTGIQTGTITINSTDSDEGTYIINLTAEGVQASSGTIDIQGNGISIVNGDTSPDVADDTDFGQVVQNSVETRTFTIINTSTTEDLSISNISLPYSDAEFSLSSNPAPLTLSPGASTTFSIDFNPLSIGNFEANVQIDHSDSANDPFTYKIAGEGVDVLILGDIMITQYYSGFNATDKWIEIKNISGFQIDAGTYFLALYDQDAIPNISSQAPTASEPIPAMAINEVLLFKNLGAAIPVSGNLGNATQISTSACGFSGDDIILISTSDDVNCYANRQDIIGKLDASTWGRNTSFIKGGCASEEPHANFNVNDWIRTKLDEINTANSTTNMALGTQVVGSTTFDGSSWSNLVSDRSRNVIFDTSFTHANQTIYACSLTVNNNAIVDFNSNGNTKNSIVIYGDLNTDNGSLTIGDKESLVTLGANPNLGTIVKIERSKTLYNIHDNTYWSSPVIGAQIQTIFSGVDTSRLFEYTAGNPNPLYAGTEYKFWWNKPSGTMDTGYGYAAEGPAAPVNANEDYDTPFEYEVSFSGPPFTGTISLNLYYKGNPDQGSENENFNLIGNPYPTAIDIDKFFELNTDVRDIALWTHATKISGGQFTNADYITYNRDGSTDPANANITKNIGSGQGFMARTLSYTDIDITDGMKMINSNDQFFKSAKNKREDTTKSSLFEGDKIWLEMRDDTGNKSNIMIGFSPRATDALDGQYDSYGYVTERDIKLYSLIDQEDSKFVIQNLSQFSNDKKVSLGIDNKKPGKFKIKIADIKGVLKDADVYLVDNKLGITHNLKESDYTFEQKEAGSFPNRFTLQFATAALGVDDFVKDNDFSIANAPNGFNINASKVVNKLKVYDMLGRMIMQIKPAKQSFNVSAENIKQGTVLIFEVTLENGAILNKKTIKY